MEGVSHIVRIRARNGEREQGGKKVERGLGRMETWDSTDCTKYTTYILAWITIHT